MIVQVSFSELLDFLNINACMYVISIMNIPTIPIRVAIPVVRSPKMLPSTIKKTAITHTKTPNAINAYCQLLIVVMPLRSQSKQAFKIYALFNFPSWI